jgi:hypothetical protein
MTVVWGAHSQRFTDRIFLSTADCPLPTVRYFPIPFIRFLLTVSQESRILKASQIEFISSDAAGHIGGIEETKEAVAGEVLRGSVA